MKALHQLPHYTPDRLMLLEIVYQMYVKGFGATMTRKKEMTWPKLPLRVRSYKIESMKQAIAETEIFGVYHLGGLPFYRHDLEEQSKSFVNNTTTIGRIHMKHGYMKKSINGLFHYKRSKPTWGKNRRLLREQPDQGI